MLQDKVGAGDLLKKNQYVVSTSQIVVKLVVDLYKGL